ncbi:metallophosphoesterase [Azoarcus sp. CIB]|uniref:metallophosphoesterase n=1 Tax=Aromatoleum sp. (strain CIB) TaxID=198107 RepID=UPI00067B8450|nr:metallophosphoesterase [Azoarcus sp. CIB]AKU11280.1 metallophosphoesterase [Azoarcus sp. CIB]
MTENTGYDIIGDVHGHAEQLEALLHKLDYRMHAGAWRHPERRAIFLGDLIDRGPKQLETVDIVRRMVDAGHAQAVMGNHEFNAIAWGTHDDHGRPLRAHSEKNRNQHKAFLAAVDGKPALHRELLDWFLNRPLWLELDGINIVHACWHTDYMARFGARLRPGNRLGVDLLNEAATRPEEGAAETLFHAVETCLKGLEAPLPEEFSFPDKEGHPRREVRVRWWDHDATHFRTAAVIEEHLRVTLPTLPLPPAARYRYPCAKPVFFGHYWMQGDPAIQSPAAACVDFSVAKRGKLVAYRWNGEAQLSDHAFLHVESASG